MVGMDGAIDVPRGDALRRRAARSDTRSQPPHMADSL
jgi:hypothetical protein